MISVQNTPLLRDGESLFTISNFILQDHHKVGLLAANGAGKTSFLAALYERHLPHNAVIAYCPQKTPAAMRSQTWNECVLNAPELFRFQQFYDWLDLFHIPADRPLEQLSGGQQRLGMIFYIMSHEATHYFFDEPTNHLDIPTIQWLEKKLQQECRSYMLISHDRAFLENVTEGIWAIHEKQLRFYPGKYDHYLEKRLLEEQTLLQQRQKNQIMLAQEERYRERGVTARRKRNQKRVERLHELRQKLSQSESSTQMNMSKVSRGSQGYRPQQIFQFHNYLMKKIDRKGNVHYTDWNTTVTREDRIALVGSNGCGKTTFLKELICDQVETILRCRELEIAFVDQHRQRDPYKTLLEHITEDPHQLIVTTSSGTQMIHPASYLESFGLSREDFSIPYHKLSGGQQMKLCLAIALLKNPDVLILDEPTNDLDQESLEDLADWLSQYQGLVFFVSHDRYFIDQCATETWYWTKTGVIAHKGGVDPVCLAKLESFEDSKKESIFSSSKKIVFESNGSQLSKKNYAKANDTKAIEKIEKQIEQLEKELKAVSEKMALAYQQHRESSELDGFLKKQSDLQSRLESLMAQWESLSH